MASAVKKIVAVARPHWNVWVAGHARRELGPPTDWGAVQREARAMFAKAPDALNTPLRRSVQSSLVAVEIAMWFFVGEIIGRKSLKGYKLK